MFVYITYKYAVLNSDVLSRKGVHSVTKIDGINMIPIQSCYCIYVYKSKVDCTNSVIRLITKRRLLLNY